jgi:cytolysin-activating lysine-acyltransferase
MVMAATRVENKQILPDADNSHLLRPNPSRTAPPFTGSASGARRTTVAQLFGEIVWLFTQSPQHKNFWLADLEWLVMTPVQLKQFRMFYKPERPVGVALWAFVTEEVERRLVKGQARLAPGDWNAGDRLWLVEVVAPFGHTDAMIMNLKQNIFPNRTLSFLGMQDARPVLKTL